jgi:hypothetical protein
MFEKRQSSRLKTIKAVHEDPYAILSLCNHGRNCVPSAEVIGDLVLGILAIGNVFLFCNPCDPIEILIGMGNIRVEYKSRTQGRRAHLMIFFQNYPKILPEPICVTGKDFGFKSQTDLVPVIGLEPTTPSLRMTCSTS